MKAKFIVSGICVLAIGLILVGVIGNRPEKNDIPADKSKDITVDAKVNEYTSLGAIETAVELIVKVKKTSDNSPIIYRNELGNVYFSGTIGNVTIQKIYKNKNNRELTEEMIIPVFENEAFDAKTNTTYHVADYKKMTIGKEYILFLNYSESDGWYVPCSAIWGKYPLDNTEPILYTQSPKQLSIYQTDYINQIGTDVIKKYQ